MDKSVEGVENPCLLKPLAEGKGNAGRGLGVFAKEPLAGQVKTRLCPPLSPGQAAELYAVSLAETMGRLAAGSFNPILFFSGDPGYFREAFPDLPCFPQGEGDLGRRMERALRHMFDAGCRQAVLLGSDSPDLPAELVEQAFAALAGVDAVTIPAVDGGYILIGESRHLPELFDAIPWSTNQVAAATRQRAASLGLSYRELGGWDDLDDLASLQRLLQRSPASAVARFAVQHLAFPWAS